MTRIDEFLPSLVDEPTPVDPQSIWERGRRRRAAKGAVAIVGLAAFAATVGVILPDVDRSPTIQPVGPSGSTSPDVVPSASASEPSNVAPPPLPFPVLDEQTDTTIVVAQDGKLEFVHVDDGSSVTIPMPEAAAGDPPQRLGGGDGSIVVYGGDTLYAFPARADAFAPVPIAQPGTFAVFVGAGVPDRVWLRPGRTTAGTREISLIGVDGTPLVEPFESDFLLVAGLRDVVVLDLGGILAAWDPVRRDDLLRIRDAFPMGTDGSRFAHCDAVCKTISLSDPRAGTTVPVATAGEDLVYTGYAGALSPDGRHVAAPACLQFGSTGQDCRLEVIEIATGRRWTVAEGHVSPHRTPVWSPDGGWVFAISEGAQLFAYRPGQDEPRRVDVPPIAGGRAVAQLLAIEAGPTVRGCEELPTEAPTPPPGVEDDGNRQSDVERGVVILDEGGETYRLDENDPACRVHERAMGIIERERAIIRGQS